MDLWILSYQNYNAIKNANEQHQKFEHVKDVKGVRVAEDYFFVIM